MAQIFFLGPAGTFTHDAARRYFNDRADAEFQPCATPQEVIRKLDKHQSDYGVVPIENSVHGEVIPTLDALLFEFSNVFVVGELSLPITFAFFSVSSSENPRIVISHPHALAQCKAFIERNALTEQSANSTADACRIVAESGDPAYGAIASISAGNQFGLKLLDKDIEDFKGAYTRFLVLSRQFHAPRGASKCMLAILPPSETAGVLSELTSVFSNNNINIFSIHSRPTRSAVGQYVFIITADGTPAEGPTRKAIDALYDRGYRLKILGAYLFPGHERPAAPYPNLPGLLSKQEFEKLVSHKIGKSDE